METKRQQYIKGNALIRYDNKAIPLVGKLFLALLTRIKDQITYR